MLFFLKTFTLNARTRNILFVTLKCDSHTTSVTFGWLFTGKFHPTTCREGTEGEKKEAYFALEGGFNSKHRQLYPWE